MKTPVFAAVAALTLVASTGAAQVGKSTMIEPNTATEQQIAAVPGLNAAIAKTIVDRRPFSSMLALDSLLGQTLSREQRTEVYRRLFLHINLNTATSAEILLIPGTASKHVHEFEEYRPYRSLDQFRREMGKYVNEQEVARLEQYVFIPMNLNTASEADLMTIPGLGPRMLHEFEEYRPYSSIEQFRREIGKYVNEREVARLERYITLN